MTARQVPVWGMAFLALSILLGSAQAATTCVTKGDATAYRYDNGTTIPPKDAKAPCSLSEGGTKLADVQTAIRTKGTIIANVAELSFPADAKPATKATAATASQGAPTAGTTTEKANGAKAAAAGDITPLSTTEATGAAQAAVQVPAGPPKKMWEIRPTDLSIYAALKRWANDAGYQVSWEIPVDYPTTILDRSEATFEDAVSRILEAYKGADYPPKGCFYENHVLRVVRRTGDGKECFR